MDIYQKFDSFIKEITKEDKIALFFDPDPDGISAGVLLHRALKQIRGKGADLILYQHHGDLEIHKENIQKMKDYGIGKVFTVDMAVDQFPQPLQDITTFATLCIIDHHTIYEDLNSEKIIYIKPQLFGDHESFSYVSAKLVYDLFSRHTDLSSYDWLASIGIVGDAAYRRWKDFVNLVCEREGIDTERILASKIGGAMRTIAAAPEFGFSVIDECFETVLQAESLEDILNSSLVKYREIIGDEIYKYVKDFRKHAESHGDIIFYQFTSKYSVGSTLSTRVSFKNPSKTVIVIQDAGEPFYRLSLRRQDGKVKVNDLVTEATKDIEGANGGGHAPAAGGRLPKEYLEQFKKNVFRILSS